MFAAYGINSSIDSFNCETMKYNIGLTTLYWSIRNIRCISRYTTLRWRDSLWRMEWHTSVSLSYSSDQSHSSRVDIHDELLLLLLFYYVSLLLSCVQFRPAVQGGEVEERSHHWHTIGRRSWHKAAVDGSRRRVRKIQTTIMAGK